MLCTLCLWACSVKKDKAIGYSYSVHILSDCLANYMYILLGIIIFCRSSSTTYQQKYWAKVEEVFCHNPGTCHRSSRVFSNHLRWIYINMSWSVRSCIPGRHLLCTFALWQSLCKPYVFTLWPWYLPCSSWLTPSAQLQGAWVCN